MTAAFARRRLAACFALLFTAGCAWFGGDAGVRGGIAEERYDVCDDAVARDAWRQAQAALARSDDRTALPLLREVVARCPDLVRAQLAYQDVARRLGGADEQAMIDACLQAPPRADSPVPDYLRARLAETAYAQSNALDRILSEHRSFAWAHLSRGRVNQGQGRVSEALRDFERAIRLDGGLHEARRDRARALGELGRFEEAAVEYERYWQSQPEDLAAAREYMTLLLYRLGRIEQALTLIERLESLGDDSLALRMDRAAAMWRARRPQAAAEQYLSILEQAPGMARAALDLGLLYYEVVPRNEAQRRLFWPRARAAFRMFLADVEPSDGHEQFERTLAVPYRLQRIAALLGPAGDEAPTIEDLRWPEQARAPVTPRD